MIPPLVTRDTKKEEWEVIRERVKARILDSFGSSPVPLSPVKNKFERICEYTAHGLRHLKIKYHVFDDEWAYGLIVFPSEECMSSPAKAVLTVHGTNNVIGKYGVCDPEGTPRRAYAIELAKMGFVTLSPDQYGFGEAMEDPAYKERYESFYERYPEWSLSCRRVLGHIRALDVLDQLSIVDHSGYGVIGNSLGGQAALYIAAFDERIKAAVISTGISPNVTNVYRNITRKQPLEKAAVELTRPKGISPWELNEVIALIAPRAALCIEPFNDPYNPYTSVTVDCIKSAQEVYRLLDRPEALSMYIHGDGHDTTDTVRSFAYSWLSDLLHR